MASQFSKDGKYYAQLTTEGKLKIWDTATSSLEQEYTPDYHLTSPCTCLHFIQPSHEVQNGSPRKKVKRRESEDPYVALGTKSGTILVYSITKGELEAEIKGDAKVPIACLSWQEGTSLFSAADNSIIRWDVRNKKVLSKWKAGKHSISAVLVVPNSSQLITGSRSIDVWDYEKQEHVRSFIGHGHDVTQLFLIQPENSGPYCISGSKGDRMLSCWNLNDEMRSAVLNFLMEDIPVSVSAEIDTDGTTRLAAVARSGVCHVYQHVLNGKGKKPVKPKRTINVTPPTMNSDEALKLIPIIACTVNEDFSIKVAYGFELLLVFENIVPDSPGKIHAVIRPDPRLVQTKSNSTEGKSSRDKTADTQRCEDYVTPYTAHEGRKRKSGGVGATDLPLETRLLNLTVNKIDGSSTKNVAHLLAQGLHSKDPKILNAALNNANNAVISNTVKRLPMNVVQRLVDEITRMMHGKLITCHIGVKWLKCILQTHTGLMISNPELRKTLSPVLKMVQSRMSLYLPLCSLKGRLNLMVSQLNKPEGDDTAAAEAMLVYNDKESSDSEPDVIDMNAQSESENEWSEADEDDGGDEIPAADGKASEDGDDLEEMDDHSDEEMET